MSELETAAHQVRYLRAWSAARHLQIDVDVWRQISDLPELTGNSRPSVGVS